MLRGLASDGIDRREIGADWTARLADGLARTLALRRSGALPPERVFDVQFADFIGNEIETDRRLYDNFGFAFSQEAELRMRRYLAAHRKDAAGAHHYRLADAGLDPAAERRRYADSQAHFRVPEEPVP